MTATSHADVARRLLANVDAGTSDQAESQMKVPIATYQDPQRWETEMEQVFRGRRSSSLCRATSATQATSTPWRSPIGRSSSSEATTASPARSSTSAATGVPRSPRAAATPGASPARTTPGCTTPRARSSVSRARTRSASSTWSGLVELPTHDGRRRAGGAHPGPRLRSRRVAGRDGRRPGDAPPRRAATATRWRPSSTAPTGSSPPTGTSTATTSATCTARRSARRRSPTATRTTSSALTSASASPTSRSTRSVTGPSRSGRRCSRS